MKIKSTKKLFCFSKNDELLAMTSNIILNSYHEFFQTITGNIVKNEQIDEID